MNSTSGNPPPKQIRFVNNEGQPPTKRRRINAACRTCRKRKTRCGGEKPLCKTCTDNGHECLGYSDEIGESSQSSTAATERQIRLENPIEHDQPVQNKRKSILGPANTARTFVQDTTNTNGTRTQSDYERYADADSDPQRTAPFTTKLNGNYRESAIYLDEDDSLREVLNTQPSEKHRVPYFRYFGPTAIVPGFKQMVVSLREHRRSIGANSSVSMSPGENGARAGGSLPGRASSHGDSERGASTDMPIYDPNDSLPVNRFIIHLVETFFVHLGCNYPFLRQQTFIQKVEDKSVEPILLDAVCALAARFSDHPLLTGSHSKSFPKSEYGHAFAQRAKSAVVDTFPCPTVAAVQACLLLAYEGFGAGQDSALWMYLGCAIRMAVDLGLQKLDGVKHQGLKDPGYQPSVNRERIDTTASISDHERQEIEQERLDTLWAVFMLDRVISSGTGRPVTLKDEDFELSFPAVTVNVKGGWPNPFPALIQIIHLYGRVSDLLNNIRNIEDVTPKKIEGLAAMEKDLTQLYQRLDQRLTFNATNFQHYCKSGEGTNFILVHFWFHTLIMLLHQPTLMHSFEGPILQLLPNSRELSMSSAKTIADILSFAELIDIRSFIGNPFTSQPMYIAACAFLMESAAQASSHPSSRPSTPQQQSRKAAEDLQARAKVQKQKHSLLASAANQNYQRCYKSLQQLETFWAGTRYILVALDQKAKGTWDPETYTEQEYESTKIRREMIPDWRRKLSLAAPPPNNFGGSSSPRTDNQLDLPDIDPAQTIGWSLTGTTNSPSSNLTFMYQNMIARNNAQSSPQPISGNMIYDPIRGAPPVSITPTISRPNYSTRYPPFGEARHSVTDVLSSPRFSQIADPATTSEAEMLLGLQNSPYTATINPQNPHNRTQQATSSLALQQDVSSNYSFSQDPNTAGQSNYMALNDISDMMIESQDIDITAMGDDMMPWLEYLPQDVMTFFDNNNTDANLPDHVDMGSMGDDTG